MGETEGFYNRIMSTRHKREGTLLPLSYQRFLWVQTRCFQKVNPEPKTCESACSALASVVREGKHHPSLRGLESVSRKFFIEAALPYVAQACAAMLRQRISQDRLSPSLIKLLSTFHWILLESPVADSRYQFKFETIEAFVKEIVPCVDDVNVQKDLVGTGDLRRGAEPIWQCLQRHMTPRVAPMNYSWYRTNNSLMTDLDGQSAVSCASGVGVEEVPVFDIAVVRALGTTSWPGSAVEWALKYLCGKLIRAKLMNIPDIQISTSSLLSQTVLSESFPHTSLDKRMVDDASQCSSRFDGSTLDRPQRSRTKPKRQESSIVSMEIKDEVDLSYFLASDSRLSITAIFDVITYQLLWGESGFSSRVYDRMLILIRECLSVGLQSFLSRRPMSGTDSNAAFPAISPSPMRSMSYNQDEELQFLRKVVWTTLLLLRHLGCCEHGCTYGIKGRQGRRLHAMAFECLTMIASHSLVEFKKLICSIVIDKPLTEVLTILHAFFCFCTLDSEMTTLQNCLASSSTLKGSIRLDEEGMSGCDDVCGLGLGDVQIPMKGNKEKEDIESGMVKMVLSYLVIRMMAEDLKKPTNLGVAQQFCMFITYLNEHHESLIRKVALVSLFDSKRQKHTLSRTPSATGQSVWMDIPVSQPSAAFISNSSGISRVLSATLVAKKLKKLGKSKSKLKSVGSQRSVDHSTSTSYLPGRRRHISAGELDPLKTIDLELVRYGVKQFSLLLGCSELGALPSGDMLAAVLDLDAPVLSRAALFLECSLLIRRCRDGHYTAWMSTHALRGAGLAGNIWQWGLALGNKLREILGTEKGKEAEMSLKEIDENMEMSLPLDDYQKYDDGDKRCPAALQLLCCQLLLEITAFLRECPRILSRRRNKSNIYSSGQFSSGQFSSGQFSSGQFSSRHSGRSASHLSSTRTASTRSDTERLLFRRSAHVPVVQSLSHATEKIKDIDREREKEREMRRHMDPDVREAVLVGPSAVGMLFLSSVTSAPVSLAIPADRRDGRRSSISAATGYPGRNVERAVSFSGRRQSITAMEAEDIVSRRHGSKFAQRRSTIFRDIDVVSYLSEGSDDDLDGYNSDGDKIGSGQSSLVRSERENFPWMSVIAEIINGMSTTCNHEYCCEDTCVRRQKKRCLVLLEALEELYSHTGKPDKYLKKSEFDVEASSVFGDVSQYRGSVGTIRTVSGSLMQNPTPDMTGLAVPGLGLTVNYDRASEQYTEKSVQLKRSNVLHRTIETFANLTLGGVNGRGHEGYGDGAPQPMFSRKRSSTLNSQKLADEMREKKYNNERIDYIRKQVDGLCHCGLSTFIVAAPVLSDSLFQSVMDSAWNMLLDSSHEISSASACVFLLASAKLVKVAEAKLVESLNSPNPLTRLNGIARFGVLWENRYQVWPRMEKDAQKKFKVPPLNIGFTLPSPPLGSAGVPLPDALWTVKRKKRRGQADNQLVEKTESILSQEQEEEADEKEHEKEARQNFRMRGIPMLQKAGIDSAAVDTEGDGPPDVERSRSYALFPAAVYSAIPLLIQLLDDAFVGDGTNTTIAEAVQHVIWNCLVEEPFLFFRPFQEKAVKSGEQAVILQSIRRLLLFFPTLPPAAAQFIYNHMIGVIMYYTSGKGHMKENSQEILSEVMSVMWQVVPSVKGLSLKTLKERLKREQCDVSVLITARQSTVRVLGVVAPTSEDQSDGVLPFTSLKNPESDQTFKGILEEASRYLNVKAENYYLEDRRTSAALVDSHYVGDHYFHRRERELHHQLRLVPISSQTAAVEEKKQRSALVHTLSELSRVLHAHSLIDSCVSADPGLIPKGMNPADFLQHHLDIMYGDLSRQWSFPRKALESNFELYSGITGRELYGVDLIHKQVWVEFICKMFQHLPESFPWGKEAVHFLNVINGTLLLHCEDQSMLRLCLSTLLGAIRKFIHLFPVDGYSHVIPTLLRVYASHSTYDFIVKSMEYFWLQCFTAHGSQFLLEMLSAAAPLVLSQRVPYFGQEEQRLHPQFKVLPVHLFSLLKCLEMNAVEDVLLLEEVMTGNQCATKREDRHRSMTSESLFPNYSIASEDSVCQETPPAFTMDTAFRLMVSVVVFDPESLRAAQMLYLLDALMPYLLSGIDRQKLLTYAQTMQILIKGCACLKETFQQRTRVMGSSVSTVCLNSPFASPHTSLHSLLQQTQLPHTSQNKQGSGEFPKGSSLPPRGRTMSLDPEMITRSSSQQAKHRLSLLPNIHKFAKNPKRGRMDDEKDMDDEGDKQKAAEEGILTLKGSRSVAGELAKMKAEAEKQREDRLRVEFRESRDSLLSLASEFICHSLRVHAGRRPYTLKRDPHGPLLLGSACHNILASVANSLLKLAPFDPLTMACNGLKKYMLQFLPSTAEVTWYADFTDKGYQEAMYKIIRRLLKIFQRLNFKMRLDWDALSALLKGPYLCMQKQPALGHLPPMRELIETVVRIITRIHGSLWVGTSGGGTLPQTETVTNQRHTLPPSRSQFFREEPPSFFCESVVRLVTMLMMSMKDQQSQDQFTLEKVCGSPADFGELRREPARILRSLLLPLCIRLGCGRSDWPRASPQDVCYAVTCLLHTLLCRDPTTPGSQGVRLRPLAVELAATSDAKADQFRTRDASTEQPLNEKTAKIVFHGLKIIAACFEKQLSSQWHQIASAVKQFGRKAYADCLPFWQFLEYLAKERGPLYIHLKAFIRQKACHPPPDCSGIAWNIIRILNETHSPRTCHGSLLQQLASELAIINELKVPKWDEDTTDIVSIAALQPPPKGRRSRSAKAVATNTIEEDVETDLDNVHSTEPPPISRWHSEPGPSRTRIQLEDFGRTGLAVKADVHRMLSPVPEGESNLMDRGLVRSQAVLEGIDQPGNLAASASYDKQSPETEAVGEAVADDITGGGDVMQVHSPSASMTSTTCTSGHGSSDESDGLPYGTMQTEGVALTPAVRQAVASPPPDIQSGNVRHKGVMQQESRRQLIKQDTVDIPDDDQQQQQQPTIRQVSETKCVLFDWSERLKEEEADTVVHWIENPDTQTSYL